MKNTTKAFGGALAITALAVAMASTAYAYQGDPKTQGPNYTPERHETMEQAFAAKDYTAWKAQMNGQGRVTQVINADNFARFAEAHALAESGNLEGAKQIRNELGLGLHNGSGQGQKGSKHGNGSRSGAKNGTGPKAGTADCLLNQ